MSAGERRPPGWYDDATDAALLRYWDGSGWTPHTSSRDAGGPQPAGTAPATADVTPALEATHRMESVLGAAPAPSDAASPPDHTTVPTPAGGPASAPVMMPAALAPSPRVWFVAAAGAITAAASLVVAFAALSVALGR